jgi:chemotaxis protein methyltransferase CheR
MAISVADFDYVSAFARRNAAIVIDRGKEYFIETRLAPIVESQGCKTLGELIAKMRTSPALSALHGKVIDALTTNETFFFRDFQPFEALRRAVLPQLIEQRAAQRRLNIWSAACSTGQEPYTLAMLLRENFPQLAGWNVSILATDLSPTVLAQARAGSYNQFEVNRGLPAPLLIKYFSKQGDRWAVKDELRRGIEFRQMNLVEPWPVFPPFDIVMIRNVMIYFDVPTKQAILKKIRACIQPRGSLFLGTAETTMNLDPAWVPVNHGKATAYQLAPTGPTP